MHSGSREVSHRLLAAELDVVQLVGKGKHASIFRALELSLQSRKSPSSEVNTWMFPFYIPASHAVVPHFLALCTCPKTNLEGLYSEIDSASEVLILFSA